MILRKKQEQLIQEIQEKNQVLNFISESDPLTGSLNRRGFMEKVLRMNREREGEPALLCFADLDHLKEINDVFGHAAGDFAIKWCSATLQEQVGASGIVGRIGGDEFCVLLSDVDKAEATACLNQLKNQLKQSSQTLGFCLAAAAGVAWVQAEESIEATMIRADDQMYKNKRGEQHVSETEIETITS